MSYFLGVDTGATKSHALIIDLHGRVRGMGVAGPGNWEMIGWEGTRRVLQTIIDQAASQAGIERAQITAAGFGLAGFDWPEDRPGHEKIIRDLLEDGTPFALVNDALIGLFAGSDAGWGVVVGAGTSCNCYGRGPQGDIGRLTGSSYYGEYAGSGELVWWAIQAVARAWSLRGPTTRLTEAFLELTGASDEADLLAGLMRRRYHIGPQHAPAVFKVAATGDPVASHLIKRAGQELGGLVLGVGRQLDITGLAFDVVMAGSFFNGSPLVEEELARTVRAEAPGARFCRLVAPPVAGAALLAMEQVGQTAGRTAALRQTLIPDLLAYMADL